jgi:hypothetical protein
MPKYENGESRPWSIASQELRGLNPFEESLVRLCSRVMEFIDDHDIEVLRVQRIQPRGGDALNRGEDVLEVFWSFSADPEFAERVVSQGVPEGGQALTENLFAVGDEEQASSREPLPQPRIVERSHDGLAGAGGRGEQVPVVACGARKFQLLEEPFLERFRAQLDGAQEDLRARGRCRSEVPKKVLAHVGDEVAAVPVALEHRRDLVDDVPIASARDPNVPLKAGHLGGVGEVRGTDVARRKPRLAVEQPRLGVESS